MLQKQNIEFFKDRSTASNNEIRGKMPFSVRRGLLATLDWYFLGVKIPHFMHHLKPSDLRR